MVLGSALCDPSEAGLQNVVAVEKGHLRAWLDPNLALQTQRGMSEDDSTTSIVIAAISPLQVGPV